MSRQKPPNKFDTFDTLWVSFDKLWKRFDKVFDKAFDELPEGTEVKTVVRVRLTSDQLNGLITGKRKRLLFKTKDDVEIHVEMKP